MIERMPKASLLSKLSVKWLPLALATGTVATAATILGVRAVLNATSRSPSSNPDEGIVQTQEIFVDEALETAIVETVVSMQKVGGRLKKAVHSL